MDLPFRLALTPLVRQSGQEADWSRLMLAAKVRRSGTPLLVASSSQGWSADAFLLRIIFTKV